MSTALYAILLCAVLFSGNVGGYYDRQYFALNYNFSLPWTATMASIEGNLYLYISFVILGTYFAIVFAMRIVIFN